jgi:hypothetical protein
MNTEKNTEKNTDKKFAVAEGLRPDKRITHRRQRRYATSTLKHWLRAISNFTPSPSFGV